MSSIFKTNAGNRLYIATVPLGSTDEEKKYKEITSITALKFNYSPKKEDRMYFHNLGESTSITTGVSKSLSVSIDFDNSDEAHKYLLNLLLGDIYLTNSQFIKLDIRTISKTTGKHITVSGKATINFKNHFPSGNADEIQKLEFDIFPQDNKWTTEEVDDTMTIGAA
ncbi:phage tail tube protein [Mycoplasmopsis felis]|uniref:phage tail tube protein n=1 Tax=Mycoplasmopsis felis TaxID=33923 RepID=UPI002B00328A|nr:hypothetical protein [Mycoplasmopsis felis]WQQ08478.1 hypothetical protein RRG61_04120 [Mycoplasmopsis felis]WQQ10445.1 hypothetical protein RRG49_01770 [Mycoplasmopsis felis]